VIGFLFTEAPLSFHPLFSTADRDIGPAIRHLDEVRASSPIFFEILAVTIGAFELLRALKGWEVFSGKNLKDDYYPGDIGTFFVRFDPAFVIASSQCLFYLVTGFDPLGFKPKDSASFNEMATKELNNGRLAMIGVAGFIAQELVNGKEIFVTLGLSPDTFDPSSLPVQF
jgi:Chlorophyll A-B binding protein